MGMEEMVPPVIVTLRAKAGELYSEFGKIKGEIAKLDHESESGLSRGQKAMVGLEHAGRTALFGIAGAGLGAAAASVHLAGNFQEATTQLVTGAGESADKIDQVKSGLLALAPAVGSTPEDLAKGMYLVESAGYHGAQGLAVMKAAAEGAKVGATDTGTVANALTTVLNDFGISASHAGDVTSQLVATVASGKTTMGDLAGALHNVAFKAAAAHISLGQVLGAMGTMTSEGTSADQASQDLANAIQSLQNPTQTQVTEMQELGLKSADISQNLGKRGLTGTLALLTGAIAKHYHAGAVWLSTYKNLREEGDKVQTMLHALPAGVQGLAQQFVNGTISSKEWRKAMMHQNVATKQLMQEFAAGVNRSRGFSSELTKSGPSAQTFGAALAKVTGGATGMNVALGLTGPKMSTFERNVKNISGTTAEADGSVKGWSETSKDFNVMLSKLTAGVQAMAIKVGSFLIPKITAAITWFEKHKSAAYALAAVIGGAVTLAIGAYVLKLARGAAETVKSYGRMVKAVYDWADKVFVQNLRTVGAFSRTDMAQRASARTATTSQREISQAQQRAASIAEETAAQQEQAASMVAASNARMAAASGEAAVAQEEAASAVVVADEEMAAAGEAAGAASSAAFGPIGLAIMGIVAVATLLVTHWKQVWGAIKDVIRVAWNDVLKPVFGWLYDIGIKPSIDAFHTLENVWNDVWGAVSTTISDIWQNDVEPVFSAISTAASDIANAVETAIGGLETAWSTIWDSISTVIDGAWNDVIKPVFGAIYTYGIKPVIEAAKLLFRIWKLEFTLIRTVLEGVWNYAIKPIFHGIVAVGRTIGDGVSWAWKGISKVFGWIKSGVNAVKSAVSSVAHAMWSILKPFVDAFKWVWHWVEKIAGWIEQKIKDVGGFLNTITGGIFGTGDRGGYSGYGYGGGFNAKNAGNLGALGGVDFSKLSSSLGGLSGLGTYTQYQDPYGHVLGANVPGHAHGGMVGDGWFTAGEHGIEIGYKRGANVSMIPLHGGADAALGDITPGPSEGGDGGGMTVIVQGSVIDHQGLFKAMQTAALRHGGQNSQTWAPYKRR